MIHAQGYKGYIYKNNINVSDDYYTVESTV